MRKGHNYSAKPGLGVIFLVNINGQQSDSSSFCGSESARGCTGVSQRFTTDEWTALLGLLRGLLASCKQPAVFPPRYNPNVGLLWLRHFLRLERMTRCSRNRNDGKEEAVSQSLDGANDGPYLYISHHVASPRSSLVAFSEQIGLSHGITPRLANGCCRSPPPPFAECSVHVLLSSVNHWQCPRVHE